MSGCVREHLGSSVSVWSVEWLKATVRWDQRAARDFNEQERFVKSRPDLFCPTASYNQLEYSASLGAVEEYFATNFSWAARLTRFMGAEYFDTKRVTIRSSRLSNASHTRTLTRSVSGNIIPRYHDCVAYAKSRL